MWWFMDTRVRIHKMIPVFFLHMLDIKVLTYCVVYYYVSVVDPNDNYSLYSSLRVRKNIWVL